MTGETTATIKVHRELAIWRDALRKYTVEVDGQHRGRVRSGETLAIDVAPGVHSLRARIDWTGSRAVPVEVTAGQTAHLTVSPNGAVLNCLWQVFTPNMWLRLTLDTVASS